MTKPVKTTHITSSSNAHFKRWRSLHAAAGIKKEGEFLVSGAKIISEAIDTSIPQKNKVEVAGLICKQSDAEDLLQEPWVIDLRTTVFSLPADLFKEIDDVGAPGPIMVAKLPKLDEANLAGTPQGLELLLSLQDPANLGAAIRLAEAFNAKVVLLKECANPFLPKAIRASSGSVFRVPLLRGPSVSEIKSESSSTVTLDLEGTDLAKFQWPKSVRLYVGAEGPGVPPHLKEGPRVRIPIKKSMDSLNAVSALSIAIYSYRLQHP